MAKSTKTYEERIRALEKRNRKALKLQKAHCTARGFQPDLLMPQGALLRRGRSDSFTPAKLEEDAVGNQSWIRQKGGETDHGNFSLYSKDCRAQ